MYIMCVLFVGFSAMSHRERVLKPSIIFIISQV